MTNAFIGRAAQPDDAALEQVLGASKSAWDALVTDVEEAHGATREWKSYSAKHGWALRLYRKKRTVLWMSPGEGCLQVGFILGDKALTAARQAKLSAAVVRALDEAVKYPEGHGVRIPVKSVRDLPSIKKLAAVKMAN